MITNLNKLILKMVILLFLSSNLFSEELCKFNILKINHKKSLICEKNQLVTGILKFKSESSNYPFVYNSGYDIHIPKTFKKEVLNFIEKLCNKTQIIRLKTITNLNDKENFSNELIVSCKKK